MAQWRKVIVSGSSAVLNQISASGNIVPTSDNGADLGSSTLEWKDLYIDGTAHLDSVDIDAGDIDGAAIGANSHTTIKGTTIDATTDFTIGGTVITDNTITDDGTLVIASTTATSFSEGNITNVGDIALDTISADDGSSLSFSNNWTNAGNTIADLGTVSAATSITATDLIGTNVDGILGADTARAITGTTIDATTDFTIDGLVITADDITNDAGLEIQTAAGDITLDPGGNNVLPGSDSADDLGASGTAWAKLWVDDIDLAGQGSISMGGTAGRIDLDADDDTSIRSAADDVITFEAGGVDILEINATSISGSSISTGSFGHLIGDGSGLTGVAQDIDLLDAYGAATLHQTQDLFHLSDNGTEKSITFSNLEDSIFANVSGDATIAAGGALTIAATSVENSMLADDAVDSDELASGAVDDDHLSDGVATGLAGAGTTATSGVINVIGGDGITANANDVAVTAAQTTITSIYNTALKIGRASGDTYIDMGTADDNIDFYAGATKIIDLTTSGIDVTGVATVSSDLTVGGNLDVNGTVTTINTANLAVNDQFIQLASGSTSETDGGIIVTKQADQAGYALGYDGGTDQWSFQNDLSPTATGIVPDAYVGVIERGTGAGDSQGVPTYGGASNGAGTIYIDTDDGEIWIYA
jgi:hypothetical protein